MSVLLGEVLGASTLRVRSSSDSGMQATHTVDDVAVENVTGAGAAELEKGTEDRLFVDRPEGVVGLAS